MLYHTLLNNFKEMIQSMYGVHGQIKRSFALKWYFPPPLPKKKVFDWI